MSQPPLPAPAPLTGPIVLAAGGTGGHLFPAEALARALLARGLQPVLVTDRRGSAFGDRLGAVPVHRVSAATTAPGLVAKLRAAVDLGRGVVEALALLRRLKPAVVVGFGGYPSVPTVQAAALLRLPLVLHEQNAVLGRANRLFAGAARRIAVSFPELAGLKPAHRARLVRTGNPVRPAFAEVRDQPYPTLTSDGPITLVVLGGSQGARIFSEVVPAALARLPQAVRQRLHLSQQCRPEDLERTWAEYGRLGLAQVELSSFFRDVPERLAAAQLVLARAGASTITELTVVGRPSLLVPYPFAMDDHQSVNAAALAAAGAAWVLPQDGFTAERLAQVLTQRLGDPAGLAAAAAAARAWGTVEAADRLADTVLDVAHGASSATHSAPTTSGRPNHGPEAA